MFEQASLSTDIVVVDTLIVIKMHYQECFPCGKCLSNLLHIFFSYFVKPFEWWASKAIGDWKGPDAGYLSAGAYFWAKADKLTWQNIPSNPRPVTFDYISRSKYISNRQIACDLSNSSQIQDNPEWIPSLPFRICQCLRPGWIAK